MRDDTKNGCVADYHCRFSHKITSLRNEHQNSILMTCHYPHLGSDESSVWNFCACLLEYTLLNTSKFMSSQRTIFCHCCFVFFLFAFERFCDSCHVSTKIFYLLAMFSFMTSAMQYFVQHRLCTISAWSQAVPLVNINEIHIQTPKGELQLLSCLPKIPLNLTKQWRGGAPHKLIKWTQNHKFADAPVLRRLASIFQGLTPVCLMLHDFGCKASTEKPQSETTYLPDFEKIPNL